MQTESQRGGTGYYHVATRSVGQIALFEDDEDRRVYLRILRDARDEANVRVIAWVLMTDHVHLVVDCLESVESLSRFMYLVDKGYAMYFNEKTARVGHLFQRNYWSKEIRTEAQLIATVHYIHMNPEAAGIALMRTYRWSSYQEYAGKRWVVDTSVVMGIFGSFDAFDTYGGSSKDVVRQHGHVKYADEDVLSLALDLAECSSSGELRALPADRRNRIIMQLHFEGITVRQIARTLGIGSSTMSRIMRIPDSEVGGTKV